MLPIGAGEDLETIATHGRSELQSHVASHFAHERGLIAQPIIGRRLGNLAISEAKPKVQCEVLAQQCCAFNFYAGVFRFGHAPQVLRVGVGVIEEEVGAFKLIKESGSGETQSTVQKIAFGAYLEVGGDLLVKDIVDTCRICRMWARPLPKSLTTVRLATDFNRIVQWDILFHRKLMVSHLLDEAIRWTAGSILKGKSAEDLISAIMTHRIRHFGPMGVLIADGKKGLASEEVAQFLDRALVQLKATPRANMPKWWSATTSSFDVSS